MMPEDRKFLGGISSLPLIDTCIQSIVERVHVPVDFLSGWNGYLSHFFFTSTSTENVQLKP
jgi:hypothetical protein